MTSSELKRLIQTLGDDRNRNRFYVYALCFSDNTPFYIGKGQGRRVLDHAQNARDAKAYIDEDESLTDEEKRLKIVALAPKLQTILSQGSEYKPVIIKWGLTEDEAFMCESALINLWNWYDISHNKTGLTNIVNGHASEREIASVADIKTKSRTVQQFLDECAIEEKPIDSISEEVVFIKINDCYPRCIDDTGTPDMFKVQESVRGIWRIHTSRRNRIKYIFALYRGRVVGVFHVNSVSREVGIEFKERAKDYPKFPEDTRKAEQLGLRFNSISEARENLTFEEFSKVDDFLNSVAERKRKSKEEIFNDLRRRVYFSVDDNVPEHIRQFMNSIITHHGSTREFCGQNPIHYNF